MNTDQVMYSDFAALTSLKKGAREKDPEAIKQVARQFESLFVQMMLKSMRDTVPENSLFGSESEKVYQDMYDKQLSLQISNGKGIGLANVIERQLGGNPDGELIKQNIQDYINNPRPIDRSIGGDSSIGNRSRVDPSIGSNISVHALREQPVQTSRADNPPASLWKSAEKFINDILPYAKKAADALGIDATVLMAQSALETGWGKHTAKNADGSNSFNLFGIKADARWDGEKVDITTREYRHGVMQHEKASFRSYDSISQAFEDYVSFIEDNPRYQKALEHGYDGNAYSRELQRAGYATDPEYANKINRLRNSELIQQKQAELTTKLKNSNKVPLT